MGDNLSDLETIADARLGVRTTGAPQVLREWVGFVARSSEERGLKEVVKRPVPEPVQGQDDS